MSENTAPAAAELHYEPGWHAWRLIGRLAEASRDFHDARATLERLLATGAYLDPADLSGLAETMAGAAHRMHALAELAWDIADEEPAMEPVRAAAVHGTLLEAYERGGWAAGHWNIDLPIRGALR